jgi:hypothetical protein
MFRKVVRFALLICIGVSAGHAAPALAKPTHALLQATSSNLVQNGGFEQPEDTSWEGCGNVRLVDAQSSRAEFVYAGRYAAFMGAEADSSGCPALPDGTTPKQILSQQIAIPADAPAVTVSFWFRAFAGTTVDIFLARGFYQFDPDLGGVKLGTFATDQPPGWQLYRTVLQDERLERVRGQTLRFSIVIQGGTDVGPDAVLLIDDVQVIAADGRTTASPLPPALRGNGSRPLAVTRVNGQNRWLYRMDTDGRNEQLIYRGLLDNVRWPAWSPDGQRIAVVDNNTWPWPTPDPDPQNNLVASAITVLNADGSGGRQIYQTQSQKGSRCPFIPSPGEPPETPSLIIRAANVQWLPDNNQVAFTQTGFGVFCDGRLATGGLSDILAVTPPSLVTTPVAQHAARPSINRSGRVLFDGADLSSARNNRPDGIWESDPSTQPPSETRLLPGAADKEPAWAPDGRRFAVVRITTSPSADISERTFAVVLYDRQNLGNPRMLLFADHGRAIGSLSWSPNGAYLVYTLERFDGRTDIWWLDVATGATGPVTTDGNALEASWRPEGQQNRVHLPLTIR